MTDPAGADPAAPDRPHRRALLGAGVIGAALAFARSERVAASSAGLSDEDVAVGAFAISFELSARDLYDAALAAGATGQVWEVMREQHASYAQLLAGVVGISADTRNDEVFDALEPGFTGRTSAAALVLENTAAATYVELIGDVDDPAVASAMASIAAMESRHAVVMAELSGQGDDFDALFLNTATPVSPEA